MVSTYGVSVAGGSAAGADVGAEARARAARADVARAFLTEGSGIRGTCGILRWARVGLSENHSDRDLGV